jgi:enoyl-[acyl-carrier protein] reductase II
MRTTRNRYRDVTPPHGQTFGGYVTLAFPEAVVNAKVLIEERVPVINFVRVGGLDFSETLAYGEKAVAPSRIRVRPEKQDFGADAVIATGYVDAAHGEPVTSLVLIPSLVDVLHVPCGAGGSATAGGLRRLLLWVRTGFAMGSRFSATVEAPSTPGQKSHPGLGRVGDRLIRRV